MKGKPTEERKVESIGSGQSAFADEARKAFEQFVLRPEFPCLGAKAAFNSDSYALKVYQELGADDSTAALSHDLYGFTRSEIRHASEYATFVAVFAGPLHLGEVEFENLLWRQLRKLHLVDAPFFGWDPNVRSDPADPHFSFSCAGQALYVIGMHANSSRDARQFRWPTLVFNPHEQFERLRTDGQWKRMQETIRERDRQLQGTINPMLSDFGEASEARQYSGRSVSEDWRAPFSPAEKSEAHAKIGRCPFAH
jgi:FPC/CPF motif-containing protein YcgG